MQRFTPFKNLFNDLHKACDRFAAALVAIADGCDQEILSTRNCCVMQSRNRSRCLGARLWRCGRDCWARLNAGGWWRAVRRTRCCSRWRFLRRITGRWVLSRRASWSSIWVFVFPTLRRWRGAGSCTTPAATGSRSTRTARPRSWCASKTESPGSYNGTSFGMKV